MVGPCHNRGENRGAAERGQVMFDTFDGMKGVGEGRREDTLIFTGTGTCEDFHFLSSPLSLSLHLLMFVPLFVATFVSSLLWLVPSLTQARYAEWRS